MKSVKGLSILVIALLLQGCLPDSFTKFEEEPAVQAEGGTSDDEVCPDGSELTDPFCLEPTRIEYSADFEFNIDTESLEEEEVFIEPQVFNASQVEGWEEYFTFTITPSLPSSTGLSFDVETGNITGVPQSYYEGSHTVSAEYTGNTPVSLTDSSETADIDISIATTLQPLLTFDNPLDKTVVLNVDDVSPFIGRTWVSAEKENGAAEIQFIDEVANQLHIDTDNIGSEDLFILRTENQLALDNKENYSSSKATSSESVIAMTPGQNLTVDDGSLSTAIYTTPAGEATTISQEELETIVYSISPSVENGLIFTEETTCYDLTNPSSPVEVSRTFCDSGTADHQLVLGGTIWGEIDTTAELPPTQYTITGTNIHGSQGERTIQLSILSPAAPKALDEMAYRQQTGQKLKITVDNATAFEDATKISTAEGKIATIDGVDLDQNQIYVTVDNEDDLYFKTGDGLDNTDTFFEAETLISEDPSFFYDDTVIDDTTQPFMKNQLFPTSIFEATSLPDIAETRSLEFKISPDIELLGVNFQKQSGCFDTSADPNDPTTWVEQLDGSSNPDFTDCDAGTTDFLEIRGGTIWGQFDPDVLPVTETEFTVTAETLTDIEVTAPFKMEITPEQEPAEFSYTQDALLVLQDQSSLPEVRFQEGDFISNNTGAAGIVKESFTADGQLFIWAHVITGVFNDEENVDNRETYGKQAGYLEEVYPINAKLTLSAPLAPADVEDTVIDDNETENIVTSGTANRARVIYENGADLYVRVTEGTFTTGQTLEDETQTSLGVTISNINAQHLALSLANSISSPVIDSNLVYSDDANGDSYLGTLSVRSVNSTPTTSDLEIEMVKGELGTSELLYLENPYTNLSTNESISSISTNLDRFTSFKDFPIVISPFVEPGFDVADFSIEPDLPAGLTLDSDTGVITGTPTDRSDFIEYTVTISNQFDNPSYQPETYKFSLEVKDFFGLIDTTSTASSYILHKAGMGNGRAPCMITRDQYESAQASQRDIQCFLEGGEFELFKEGLDLQVKVGKDMCQYVSNSPFHFARLPAGATSTASSEVHEGDTTDPACQDTSNVAVAADPSLEISPQEFCSFDHSTNNSRFLDSEYNCDESIFDYTLRSYEAFESCDCSNQDGTTDPGGNCPDGEAYDADTCGACDDGTSLTEAECDSNIWTSSSSQDDCDESSDTIEHQCDGEIHTCIEGAGKDILSKDLLYELLTLTTPTQNISEFDVSYSAPDTNGYESNRHLANFINHPFCHGSTNYIYQYDSLDTTFRDRAQTAIDNQEITESFTGRPFYTFNCLDGSNNVEARIRLIVRDWNREFRASSDIDTIDPDAEQTNEPDELMDLSVFDDDDINFGFLTNSRIDFEGKNFTGGSCSDIGNDWPDNVNVDARQGPPPYSTVNNGTCQDCDY